ncbi:uncharacterized protein LOC121561832 [Coregonus clupeaformis]|uniref:uncharacterized protein LOC121561832 n=2 Tax=Coregonus clupeaformis TaxID=59861 RepID=UPI001E1C4849|nr:uncharacterized protein LOC121561832 [Coregonus clupeaformis]
MISVRCEEPQRIYDLLKRYGLKCSNVWDSTISLSARSPCTALCDHNMNIVHVNRIPYTDTFGEQQPDVSTFYHNMKHVRMKTERNVLRHKPYTLSRPAPTAIPPLQLSTSTVTTEVECIPVALYYNNDLAKLRDVIKADGRFVQCVDPAFRDSETRDRDPHMVEVENSNTDLIMGPGLIDVSDDEAEDTGSENPFTCFCCYATANIYLECGHLCCTACIQQLKTDDGGGFACGICRKASSLYKPMEITHYSDCRCTACLKQKQWVSDCGHLTCTCYTVRCIICSTSITGLRRLFTS